ncbi:hypothetical protein CPB83DRAFT_860436 [Crepidotus variabilis]|uniref:Uncharacterized protein n=1 Tax=Crepidotus variabilis TaxID=179855 RepID=A0A9P6E9C8_9AGAR|nr:hypothetical protein CPB83DRAFT_860436 [Crepidotus variabilis]
MATLRPALPPTTNTLTAQQRTVLLRKSRKIEQLLGSTPYFVNLSNISVQDQTTKHAYSGLRRRASLDTTLLPSSSLSHEVPTRSSTMIRRKRYRRTVVTSGSLVSNTWGQHTDIPMLRIELDRLHMEPITAAPSSTRLADPEFMQRAQQPDSPNTYPDQEEYPKHTHETSELQSNALEELEDSALRQLDFGSTTISSDAEIKHEPRVPLKQRPATASSSFTHLPISTHSSPASFRKAKMDRLRKKLGARVPLELVFPDESNLPLNCRRLSDESPSYSLPPSFSSPSLKIRPETGSPVSSAPLTEASQDLVVPISPLPTAFSLPPPPRPKKSPKRPSNGKHGHRRRAVRSMEVPPPVPPLNFADFKPLREKLSLILEMPEETSSEPKGLEISLRYINESPNSSRPSTAGSVTSSMSGAWATSTAPTTPTSSTISCTSSSLSTPRKRPSSYRKAPPPITDDLMAALNQTILPSYHP